MNDANDFDVLEQYNFHDDYEYIHKVMEKYAVSVGTFIIYFSLLENQLNENIAEAIQDRGHQPGFIVIKGLTTRNKIDLFYDLYIQHEQFANKNCNAELKELSEQLNQVNTFRNSIVHADWQSLSKNKFVRTKIVVDGDEGYVKFKKVEMSRRTIRSEINKVKRLTDKLYNYKEKVFESLYSQN